MCRHLILPTTLDSNHMDTDIVKLIYIFNRWLNLLMKYGKLDNESINTDFSVIARVLKDQNKSKDIRKAVAYCRDYALSANNKINDLIRTLRKALHLLSDAMDNAHLKKVKKIRSNQGMTERYNPLSKRLAKEKIRKIGKSVLFTDSDTDDKDTSRLVRRFVEKRAAQMVHSFSTPYDVGSNRYRYSIRRAISFSLYRKNFTDYDARLRAPGTHWKVVMSISRKQVRLKAKRSYNSYEEALAACKRHMANHPDDYIPINPYQCDFCGKWHIGHDRQDKTVSTDKLLY